MMIQFTRGDMLAVPADIRVNSVNCKGVMGTGVALAFKQRYPEMFRDYQRACRDGTLRPGTLHVWKNLTGDWVVNFPTKRDWRDPSRYEDIRTGLQELRRYLQEQGRVSVAIPALGCGHGGLDWGRVSSMIKDELDDLDASILVFEPADSHDVARVARDQPTEVQLRALENLDFHATKFARCDQASDLPPTAFVKGDPELLASGWIALLPSKSPGEREQAALQAIARQMVEAPSPVTVGLVHSTRATEDVVDLLLEDGISVVLILPFGPLTRKKIARTPTERPRAKLAMISVAAPEERWSRAILAQCMAFLRSRASGVLISDPEPKWLGSRAASAWSELSVFYLRYGSLPDTVYRMLSDMGAQPISRNANTGEPNLRPLFDLRPRFMTGSPKPDSVGWENFHLPLTAASVQRLRDVATAVEHARHPDGVARISVPCGANTEDLRTELRRIAAKEDDAANKNSDEVSRAR
jgi:O-acetyl-ADP-ribose deacetylase (regulator of RNase III)